jgi:glycosyltransferase involved in cell wall biosynthesis
VHLLPYVHSDHLPHRTYRWLDLSDCDEQTNIILGPAGELHAGIHGSLIDHPPNGVRYWQAEHMRIFRTSTGAGNAEFNPCHDFAIDEVVRYQVPQAARVIIHSSRLPSLPLPWIVDCDSLLPTLEYGSLFGLSHAQDIRKGLVPNPLIRQRVQNMLRRYLDGACVAILYRTGRGRTEDLQVLSAAKVLAGADLESLAKKTDVAYPALPARPPKRRSEASPVTVLFSGRSTDKGGETAARVFQRLSDMYGRAVRLVYIGPIPGQVLLPAQAEVHPVLPRDLYLRILSEADIYVSPTEYESVGMALLEAGSYGCVTVTRYGCGMEHVDEFFEDGAHAIFVRDAYDPDQVVREFTNAIVRLVSDRGLLAAMSCAVTRLFTRGHLSIEHRNAALLKAYDAAGRLPIKRRTENIPRRGRIMSEKGCIAALAAEVGEKAVRELVPGSI